MKPASADNRPRLVLPYAVHWLRTRKRRLWRDSEYEAIAAAPLAKAREYEAANTALALSRVPYYQNYAGLSQFPPLTKAIIRRYFADLQAPGELAGCRQNTSGGSTGQPVVLLQDAEYDRYVGYALRYYYERILGCDFSALRKLMLWGSERDLLLWTGDWKKKLRGLISQTRYVNAFALSEPRLAQCVELINRFQPHLIRGYASSLLALAQYLRRTRTSFARPQFLLSSAETLTAEIRRQLEETFDCPVFDLYGSRECGAIAGQCRAGAVHLFCFNQAVEVVNNENQAVGEGEEGRVLVTTLHNRAMPLLRFEIGDMAIRGGACSCGDPLPTLRAVRGRISDNFVTSDGSIVHGEYFTHLFYFRKWVRQFQVIQQDFNQVLIRLALAQPFPPGERQEIEDLVRRAMGPGCQISFDVVAEIPPSPQGKHLFTFSRVRPPA